MSIDFYFGMIVGSTLVYIITVIAIWLQRANIQDAVRLIITKKKNGGEKNDGEHTQ